MSDPNEIHRFADTDALVRAAAERFVDAVVAAQRSARYRRRRPHRRRYGDRPSRACPRRPGVIDWAALDVFFGDERFLPTGDPERNEVQAHRALLDHVPVDPARVHVMAASDGAYNSDPVTAAAAYGEVLETFAAGRTGPLFDVHLLGMGGEGTSIRCFPTPTRFVRRNSWWWRSPIPPSRRRCA